MSSDHAIVQLPDRFDVALSFAGPQRELASQLAYLVRAGGFEVFYDDYYQAQLWGEDLAILFDEIYRKRARYCVILKSQEYLDRIWTVHERRSAVTRSLQEKGRAYLLPLEVEDVELPGVPSTVGHISLERYSIDQIAAMLIAKLQPTLNDERPREASSSGDRQEPVTDSPTATLEHYLIDPYQNRIRINRLVLAQVDKVLPWLKEHIVIPGDSGGPQYFLQEIPEFERLNNDLITLFAFGCQWGDSLQFSTWQEVIIRLWNASRERSGPLREAGFEAFLIALLAYSGGIATLHARQYETLFSLLSFEIEDEYGNRGSLAWFLGKIHVGFDRMLPHTQRWQGKYQPFSEQLHVVVREPLRTVTSDDSTYENIFDHFEYLLALLYTDQEVQRSGGQASWAPAGRFIWRDRHAPERGIIARIQREVASAGPTWPLFQVGFFGGSPARFEQVATQLNEFLQQYSRTLM